ncbi:MAG: isoprenylcysteine carboxylmethyltransferase family protein [Caulobacteraceae bacterium]
MILRLVVQTFLLLLVMALVLLLAAGDPSWPAAWAFLLEIGVLGLAVGLWLAARDPALLARRLASPWRAPTARGDRRLMTGLAIGFFLWLALMGLEIRLNLSETSTAAQGIGVLLIAAAIFVSWRAFAANSFAGTAVRIEPGQRLADTGPYALVRHPLYGGAIAFFIGAPLMLGSWLGLLLAPLFVFAIAARALGEERLLRAELPGYEAYAARVRRRFIPYLW